MNHDKVCVQISPECLPMRCETSKAANSIKSTFLMCFIKIVSTEIKENAFPWSHIMCHYYFNVFITPPFIVKVSKTDVQLSDGDDGVFWKTKSYINEAFKLVHF